MASRAVIAKGKIPENAIGRYFREIRSISIKDKIYHETILDLSSRL